MQGWLYNQPVAYYSTTRKQDVVRCKVLVEGEIFPILAFGECAEKLSGTPANSAVRIEGVLFASEKIQTYKAQLNIEATSVEVLSRPRRGELC